MPGSKEDGSQFNDDRHCFVCGEKNAFGLGLQPRGNNGVGTIEWLPDRRHQGFEGVVHGGLVSTLLDEAMAYAAMSIGGFCATAEITVKFRRPVLIGVPVRIEAEVTEQRGRIIRLRASLLQEDTEKASGTGTFIRVPGKRIRD